MSCYWLQEKTKGVEGHNFLLVMDIRRDEYNLPGAVAIQNVECIGAIPINKVGIQEKKVRIVSANSINHFIESSGFCDDSKIGEVGEVAPNHNSGTFLIVNDKDGNGTVHSRVRRGRTTTY